MFVIGLEIEEALQYIKLRDAGKISWDLTEGNARKLQVLLEANNLWKTLKWKNFCFLRRVASGKKNKIVIYTNKSRI